MENLKDKIKGLRGKIKITKTDSKTGKVISVTDFIRNVIVEGTDLGVALVLQRLGSINTFNGNITHCELGTGTTPVSISDTGMETSVARAAWAEISSMLSNTEVEMQFFFPDADLADGIYTEFGTFIASTDDTTLGDGQFFSHLIISPSYTKSAGEDTTISYTLEIAN